MTVLYRRRLLLVPRLLLDRLRLGLRLRVPRERDRALVLARAPAAARLLVPLPLAARFLVFDTLVLRLVLDRGVALPIVPALRSLPA